MSKLFLNEKRIAQLLTLAEPEARDYALFQLALSTALRVSDLIKLKITDALDSDGKIVRVLRVKMKKTKRYIERPLREDCRAALARYLKERGKDENPYLFRPQSNNQQISRRPIHRTSAHRIFRRYLEQLYPWSVLQGQSCHITRRSVAKLVSDKAGRIEPATELLGHASVATTMAYLDRDGYREQADTILKQISW